MKTILTFLGFGAVILSCNNAAEKTTDTGTAAPDSTKSKPAPATDTAIAGCYLYVSGRDTVSFQIDKQGESLRGPLSYSYFEKDRNDGNFEGAIDGEVISGYYLFRSEGVMSVRQEIFRYTNGQLVPASGEVIQRNDSTVYKNPATVTFETSRALKKVPCML